MANPIAGLSGLGTAEVRVEPGPRRLAVVPRRRGDAAWAARAASRSSRSGASPPSASWTPPPGAGMAEVEADIGRDAKSRAGGRPSLLQDVMRRRRTEIEYLNGYVVAEGRKAGVPTPFNEAIVDVFPQPRRRHAQARPTNLEPLLKLLPMMRIGVSEQSARKVTRSAAGRAVHDRARGGRAAGRARLALRRRPPRHAGASTTRTCRSRPACSPSGATRRPAACSCCRCGTRCCWPSRSARWPRSPPAASSSRPASATTRRQFAAMGTTLRDAPSAFEAVARRRAPAAGGRGRQRRPGASRFREARVALRPAEPVDVWIGASAPPAIDRAARLGEGWLAAPGATPEQARAQITLLSRALRRPRAHADRDRRPPRHLRGRLTRRRRDRAGPWPPAIAGSIRRALVIGTVDEVIARFRDSRRAGLHRRDRPPCHRRPAARARLARAPR